ncbi:methyl-accepting chemotaxis sensory transducer with Cache sensor [Pseudomonas sp. NFACC37-1]|nr:methyl-accepting chemotaxis sensory transducer with Cache sensor [Pseudomonas sp. NFACC37-1]
MFSNSFSCNCGLLVPAHLLIYSPSVLSNCTLASLSIKFRIAGLAGLCMLGTVSALVAFSINNINGISTLSTDYSTKMLGDSALQYMQSLGQTQAQLVSKRFSDARIFGDALMQQVTYHRAYSQQQKLDPSSVRKGLIELLQNQVTVNSEGSGVGIGFAANALDGSDSKFVGDKAAGGNETGRFAPYIYASPQMPGYIMSDKEMADDGTPGTFWYTCAMKSGKDCVTNPYSFTNSEGVTALMSTVSIPILAGTARLGVICVDISLGSLQQIVDASSQGLYDGKSQITFVSADGVIAARSGEPLSAGRKFSEVDQVTSGQLIEHLGDQGPTVLKAEGKTAVVAAFAPIQGGDNWAVIIQVPDELVFASSNALHAHLSQASKEATTLQTLLGVSAALVSILILWLMAGTISRPILRVADVFKDIASGGGDLTRRVDYAPSDEVGSLTMAFNQFLDKLQPIIRKVSQSADCTRQTAGEAAEVANQTSTSMHAQLREVHQAAAASLEMSATSQDVARNAALAADAVRRVDGATQQGQKTVDQTTQSITKLASKLDLAVQQAETLSATSLKIGGVLDIINSVAEQTNLLALNAAIEAARAGDSGRGFAVVADEVRHLAKRTQDSVAEIQVVIEHLQQGTGSVVSSIRDSHSQAVESVQIAKITVQKFRDINHGVEVISDMTLQIASAAEEQSAVSEEVSRNISAIRDVAQSLTLKAEDSATISQSLSHLATEQMKLMSNFKV